MSNTLKSEQNDGQVEEIASLCMNCHENGTTRLLLTRIPFFREVVIMSFTCPSCHFTNNEIQSVGEIQQRGVRLMFRAESMQDLQRQVVKSDKCTCRIEDIDLEISAGRGQLTNVEGLLSMVRDALDAGQAARREVAREAADKISGIIQILSWSLEGTGFPCTISLDDPSGNSFIEPDPTDRSGKNVRAEYPRTPEQNAALGLGVEEEENGDTHEQQVAANGAPPSTIRPQYSAAQDLYPAPPPQASEDGYNVFPDGENDDIVENQVYTFPTTCPGCSQKSTVNMKMVQIPHFSEVLVISTHCNHCGYRSNEVKSGGKVPEKGRRIKLRVRNREDLSRDILKAESCRVECPEMSLNVEPGTLGGRFTTIEGLLTQVRDDLRATVFDTDAPGSEKSADSANSVVQFMGGDSMKPSDREKWDLFFGQLDIAISGEQLHTKPFTVILTDPMAASYVQSFKAPDPDEHIQVEDYKRTKEEEDDLGLTDMATEGYEGDPNETIGHASNPGRPGFAVDADAVQKAVQEKMKELEGE